MISINKSIIVGYLGKAPILKKTTNNKSYCFLNLATTEVWYKDNGQGGKEKVEHTDWHTVKVWGKDAESCCQYLQKGQQVGVEGTHCNDLIKGQNGQPDRWFAYIKALPSKVDFGYRSLKSQGIQTQKNSQATPAPANAVVNALAQLLQGGGINKLAEMLQAAPPAPNQPAGEDDYTQPPEEYEAPVQAAPPAQIVSNLLAGL
jgi:single-strand DNA-binding protein